MISLEQIKKLEERVLAAVERIRTLSTENTTLKANLTRYEERIDELEKLVSAFKSEQAEIEAGILSALTQLDSLEDSVTEPAPAPEPAKEPEPAEVTTLNLGANNSADQASREEHAPPEDSAPAEDPAPGDETAAVEPVNPDDEEPELDIF